MRGKDDRTEGPFSYVSCEARVPGTHPLRPIRAIADEALEVLSAEFDGMYSRVGRPSIPPEKLLRALLLQGFYSKVIPHIAVNDYRTKTGKHRKTAIDGRTTRHPGYAVSLRISKRIEEVFGWMKTVGGLRKTRHEGKDRVGWMFSLTAAAYNLVRLPKLMAAA